MQKINNKKWYAIDLYKNIEVQKCTPLLLHVYCIKIFFWNIKDCKSVNYYRSIVLCMKIQRTSYIGKTYAGSVEGNFQIVFLVFNEISISQYSKYIFSKVYGLDPPQMHRP